MDSHGRFSIGAMKAPLLAISWITEMPPSCTLLGLLRWVLCAAPVIILLGHACIPFAGGHAGLLDLVTGKHHAHDDAHHETHLASCDQAPMESRGSFQAPKVDQVCDVTASSSDLAPIIAAVLSSSTTAADPSHLPIFLLHTSLLI
jgi:hypothetical protein